MKPNRSVMGTILKVMCAMCVFTLLVSGCATTGGRKDAGAKSEPTSQASGTSASLKGSSGGSAELRTEPAVSTRAASEKLPVKKAGLQSGANRAAQKAAPVKQGLGRAVFEALRNLDWNRVIIVVGGILGMAFFWILAFWLGRLRLRRPSAGRRRATRPMGEPAGAALAP